MSLIVTPKSLTVSGPITLKDGTALSFDELNNISTAEINDYIKSVVKEFDFTSDRIAKFIKNAVELFAYDGFDPKVVYRHMISIQKKKGISSEIMEEEIWYLLTAAHLKGSLNVTNFRGFAQEAQLILNGLLEKWSIVSKIGNNKKGAVTIARLAIAHPLHMCVISDQAIKDFAGPFDSSRLPGFMKNSVFASIVPLGSVVSSILLAAANAYATDQKLATSKSNYLEMSEEALNGAFLDQYRYTDISFHSAVFEQERRVRAMKQLKVVDHYDAIIQVAMSAKLREDYVISRKQWREEFAKFEGVIEEDDDEIPKKKKKSKEEERKEPSGSKISRGPK